MKHWNEWKDVYRNFLMLGQLGLSFITPTILCLLLCWWLTSHMGVGLWVYILGFFFGLGGSFTVAYNFYCSLEKQDKKKEVDEEKAKKKRVSYNRHL